MEGMAFDQLKPPLSVTDPRGQGLVEWPRHVHKAGVSADGGPVYLVVQTPEEEAAAIAEGWYLARADALKATAEAAPAAPPPRKR
jgi:hypothetical protein